MLLVLFAIAVYEGLSWGHGPAMASLPRGLPNLLWSLDCLHALLVVVVCTMPDLLLQQVSSLMAASRVAESAFQQKVGSLLGRMTPPLLPPGFPGFLVLPQPPEPIELGLAAL